MGGDGGAHRGQTSALGIIMVPCPQDRRQMMRALVIQGAQEADYLQWYRHTGHQGYVRDTRMH